MLYAQNPRHTFERPMHKSDGTNKAKGFATEYWS